MKCQYLLDGKIQDGDTQKVRAKFATIDRFNHPNDLVLCLNSVKGSYSEAIRLAKYLDSGIATVIPEQSRCENACAVAFLGGRFIHRENPAFSVPKRTMHPTSVVGFRAISRELLSKEGADNRHINLHQKILDMIEELAIQRNRWSYNGLRLQDSLFAKLVGDSNQPVYYIETVGDAVLNGIQVHNVGFISADISTAIQNICNNAVGTIMDRRPSSPPPIGKVSYINDDSYFRSSTITTEIGFGQEGLEPCQIILKNRSNEFVLQVSIQQNGRYLPYPFTYVPPAASFPTDTQLKSLSNAKTLNIKEFIAKAEEAFNPTKRCSIGNKTPKIINVQNFTNLRKKSNVNSQILGQVPLGSEVSVSEPTFFWSKEPCATACLDLDQKQIQSCIDQNLVWIKVQHKGQEGFLSRRFLK